MFQVRISAFNVENCCFPPKFLFHHKCGMTRKYRSKAINCLYSGFQWTADTFLQFTFSYALFSDYWNMSIESYKIYGLVFYIFSFLFPFSNNSFFVLYPNVLVHLDCRGKSGPSFQRVWEKLLYSNLHVNDYCQTQLMKKKERY